MFIYIKCIQLCTKVCQLEASYSYKMYGILFFAFVFVRRKFLTEIDVRKQVIESNPNVL